MSGVNLRMLAILAGSALVLNACAANRVTGPASKIGPQIASFQADLSKFQTTVKTYQTNEDGLTTGNDAERDRSVNETNQVQTQWAILNAKDAPGMFAALQAQGSQAVTNYMNPAPAAQQPAIASIPVDKLGVVVNTLQKIATSPDAETEIEFLICYGSTVYEQANQGSSQSQGSNQAAGICTQSSSQKQ